MRRVVVRAPGGGPGSARPIEDPSLPYAQISARLGIPAGSIGPTRAAACGTAPSSGHRRLIHTDAQTIGSEEQPARARVQRRRPGNDLRLQILPATARAASGA